VLSYQDSRKDVAKRALVEGDSLAAVRLAGETKAAEWLADMMVQGIPPPQCAPGCSPR
jgi:NAD(P)H-nitrite reductase large subunit